MKIKVFILLLLPLHIFAQQVAPKSPQVQIDEIKYQINNLAETQKDRKIEILEARIEQATTTIENQTSTIEDFGTFYACVSILITLLGVGIPVGTYLVAVKPAKEEIAKLKLDLLKKTNSLRKANAQNIENLNERFSDIVENMSNENSMQLEDLKNSFSDRSKEIDEKYDLKAKELRKDYNLMVRGVESNFWANLAILEARDNYWTKAAARMITAYQVADEHSINQPHLNRLIS